MSPQNNSPFYYSFKGIAWKLKIDLTTSVLVVEWREEESREVDFSAIDLDSQKELWKGLYRKEKWWIGLDEARNGFVVLHGYKNLQNPKHKGVMVFDIRSGKFLWEQKDFTFMEFYPHFMEVYDPSEEEWTFKKLSLNDGKVIGEVAEEERKEKATETIWSPIVNSRHYSAENKHFGKISSFIEGLVGNKPEAGIDYLEHNSKIILSFYIRETGKLVNYMLVVTEEEEILYHERISEEIQGIGLETFFLYKDLLIFVKNKKELVILEL